MSKLPPGWYTFTSPCGSHEPTDLHGPFLSRADVLEWLADNDVMLTHAEPPSDVEVVFYDEPLDFGLPHGEEYRPWACGIHQRLWETDKPVRYLPNAELPSMLDVEFDGPDDFYASGGPDVMIWDDEKWTSGGDDE